MEPLQKKEVLQAVVVVDNFNDNFIPLTNTTSLGLLPLANVPLIDYTLEALNRCGVEEVFLFCTQFIDQIKTHISNGIKIKCSWSVNMSVQFVSSEGCRCLGDALRDLDGKGLIRGHFILMNVDTITNAKLLPILEEHKKNCKYDKGAAMTLVYKKVGPNQRTGDEVIIATEKLTKRLLFHQRLKSSHKERHFKFPLEIFVNNREVIMHHDLIDPSIAICGPTVLPLFADNFDFESRDDFIRGLLLNEEILASTLYVSELLTEQYAARVSNWSTYQMISNDVVNRWVYPLVPDMGICGLEQHYIFHRKNIYKNKNVHLARGSMLKSDVVIHEKCSVDDKSEISHTVVGRNCKIGKNCKIVNSFIFDNVTIEDNCTLNFCIIGRNSKVGEGSEIRDGAAIGDDCIIPKKSEIVHHLVQSFNPVDDFGDANCTKLGDRAFILSETQEDDANANSDDEDDIPVANQITRISQIKYNYASSIYSSSSDDEDSQNAEPIQEDSNIFLSEVIESLKRGYEEKSNPEFLVLEINSSRYAYNMTLTEVNFYVVKAILSFPKLHDENANILNELNEILKHLGPVVTNYIRGASAMRDCLKAFEETCNQSDGFRSKVAQLIHYLYDKEIVTEDAILKWHENLDEESEWMQTPLSKLITWLKETSDGETSEEEE